MKHWKRNVSLANCDRAPRGAVFFHLDLPGGKVSCAATEVLLKFLCFELCLWEPFISVTCFTFAVFSQVPETLPLPLVKDKESRSVVSKGSWQRCLFCSASFLRVFLWVNFNFLEPGGLRLYRRVTFINFASKSLGEEGFFFKEHSRRNDQ